MTYEYNGLKTEGSYLGHLERNNLLCGTISFFNDDGYKIKEYNFLKGVKHGPSTHFMGSYYWREEYEFGEFKREVSGWKFKDKYHGYTFKTWENQINAIGMTNEIETQIHGRFWCVE
jgi:hypothetical protein